MNSRTCLRLNRQSLYTISMFLVAATFTLTALGIFYCHRNGNDNTALAADILTVNVSEGRTHLTGKVRRAFEHVYNVYNGTFDWILKADDDTYVIMENLQHLLSYSDPSFPSYLGFHMKPHVRNGYMSGGGGYVISSRALRDLIENGFKKKACLQDGGDEDVEMGKCLQHAGVPVLRSLDIKGKETFHPEHLRDYLSPPYPTWLHLYSWNSAKNGPDCCSEYSITFHHLSHRDMYVYEHLLYRTSVFGEKAAGRPKHVYPNKVTPG